MVGGRDVTDRCDSLTFSATDPGGFEIATLGLPATDRPKKGNAVTIRSGLDVAWAGRVAEISDHSQHGRATKSTGCEGNRALLRDTLYSMVYVDRDLTRWTTPSYARQIYWLTSFLFLTSMAVGADDGGNPALIQTITGAWSVSTFPYHEAWYDAGPGNIIGNLYYDMALTGTLTDTFAIFAGVNLDNSSGTTSYPSTANLYPGPASGYYTPPTLTYRWGNLFIEGPNSPGGKAGGTKLCAWRKIAVYGNHGLTGRGSDPVGYWPSDIAKHALAQSPSVDAGVIPDASTFVVPHAVYRSPTPVDTVVDDMARLMGWTWGVWEPATVLGSRPRMDFRPPPTDATAVVTKAECDQLDITSRLGDLYSQAQVTYTDTAGQPGVVTVTLANAQLNEAGIATRTLLLNMGIGSVAAATTFGNFALALSQNSARAAGQATLPASVRLPNGGSKPAHLLRPGIDRLRITDLVDGGPLLDVGTVRRDVFRISRTETTVSKDGTCSTRVELDSGANLLETLQARLSLAAGVVGSGASGG